MAGQTSSKCSICKDDGGRLLGPKGTSTLIKTSKQRCDYLLLQAPQEQLFVHDKCYKNYTASKNILKAVKHLEENNDRENVPSLRSSHKPFDYPTHCLICAKELDFQEYRRHPERNNRICNIDIVNTEKKSVIQESLLNVCEKRADSYSTNIKSRILFAGDLRAVEAKYHQGCMQFFMTSKNFPVCIDEIVEGNTRNLDYLNDAAFPQLCEWIDSTNQAQQLSLHDIRSQLSTYLPADVPAYSTKHIKRRLQEHFGSAITITEIEGKKNVVTLRENVENILHESYTESLADKEYEERNTKLVKDAGNLIRGIVQESTKHQSTETYPSASDVNVDKLSSDIPDELLQLIKAMCVESRSQSANQKKTLLQLSICQAIMQAAGYKSFISPLLLSVGLFIHQTTRSRILLDVLSSLGFSASYDQVMAFERAAVADHSINDLHPGIVQQADSGGFCQWVADNFDYNEDTVTGHGTTHVMGIIACQTPKTTDQIGNKIQRRDVSAEEIAGAGDFGAIIKPYKQPPKQTMADVRIKFLNPANVQTNQYKLLDTLWLYSSCLHVNPPNWQGFMSSIVKDAFQCSSIVYNPMIPLNPQTNEAVYSTMLFVESQAKKAGMCCGTLTFDQPLYLKAYKIKQDNQPQFQHMFLRLGGFHQLMSFLGAGCKLMEGSGLEELWTTVYANNSLPKMMEGKSYTKTLRACLLTDAALHLTLLGRSTSDQDVESTGPSADSANGLLEDNTWSKLEELFEAVYTLQDVSPEQAVMEGCLNDLHQYVNSLKEEQRESRTGQLWLMFMDFVSVAKMFIRAERTGNWSLHLQASQNMLPYLAAAGHNNYTKCCRLYLADCQELCACLEKPLNEGLFTIRRNDDMFWSGTWSDMTIEQSLMRAGKTRGGLINITHQDSARTKWLLSAHVVAQYTDALRSLTDTFTGTWSEQHREIHPSNIKRDLEDLQMFQSFLHIHNPFITSEDHGLQNIATGVIADSRVNVDSALEIGTNIQTDLTGQRYGDIVMKKTKQAKTFAIMRKPMKVNGEEVRMSSAELYQRLLSISYTNGLPEAGIFAYELATVSPALFQDDGSMRKSQKSVLAKMLMQMDPDILVSSIGGKASLVVDGCALIHHLPWPKVGTMSSVCEAFVSAVKHRRDPGVPVCVVFDSYHVTTTKDQEQKRRKHQLAHPDVRLEDMTPVPSNKPAFLSNRRNKQNFIMMLSRCLEESTIEVIHAGEEGDADLAIVRQALEFAKTSEFVNVVADDTDILVLLLHHSCSSYNIFMETKSQTVSIKTAQEVIGMELCTCLPFIHSMSGCDTTSAFYGIGKVKCMKLLQASQTRRTAVLIFGETSASHEDVCNVGEQIVLELYGTGSKSALGLDHLRFLNVISSKYIPVERMPPTSRACYFHCLRVHLQVSTWRNLKTVLKKEDCGFRVEGDEILPVITDLPAAPPNLLNNIRCSCKSTKNPCSSCTCSKTGLPCSIHCKCEARCVNGLDLQS